MNTGNVHGRKIREGNGNDEQEDEGSEDEEHCRDTECACHFRQLCRVVVLEKDDDDDEGRKGMNSPEFLFRGASY